MTPNRQKKIAIINDLSGYGRCSLTVAIPVISAMKVQCCPVPTSILSNHTGFPSYFFDDYTDKMIPYLQEWEKLSLDFDGILSGFLGSKKQIQIVLDMIQKFKKPDTRVIIDPIMGDHGKPYQTYTPQMCQEMKKLVCCGDVVTPNLTEACILTDKPYRSEGFLQSDLCSMVNELHGMGPSAIIITGVREGGFITNVVSEAGREPIFLRSEKAGNDRPGTGDLFSSIVAAALVNGNSLTGAAKKAAEFVQKCIRKSEELEIPVENGVCFEEFMTLQD